MRELSGPRPLRRAMDIDSKPRIWNHNAGPFRSKPSQLLKLWGAGRTATPPTSSPPNGGVTLTPQLLISSSCAEWRVMDVEEYISASGTLLRRIFIYLVLRTVTQSVLLQLIRT